MRTLLQTVGFALISAVCYAGVKGGPYEIEPLDINAGGTRSVSADNTYTLSATTGQPSAVGTMAQSPYQLASGFGFTQVPFIDSDGDGVADEDDLCPGFDDNADTDLDGVPDGCDLCPGADDNALPAQPTLFVNAGAIGANNGTSWADAFTGLQPALCAAANSGGVVTEIWVAQGPYTPTNGTDRSATFQLLDGVAVYGGFAGGEIDVSQRDSQANVTILSGDLNGDDIAVADPADLLTEPTRAENSLHVVTGSGTNQTAALVGFTITGANAGGASGGGMLNVNGSPTVVGCIFRANAAEFSGGGMYNLSGSNPTLTDCTLSGNSAKFGGGMLNSNSSSPTLTNCLFTENSAQFGGGIHSVILCSPTLTNCTLSDNAATGSGGAMFNADRSSPTLTNCTFRANSAMLDAGGIWNGGSSDPTLTNCTFAGNAAGTRGGAISNNSGSSPTLTNCTFNVNSATFFGGGMNNADVSSPTVANCIFWNNRDSGGTDESAQIHVDVGSPVVNHTLVQGGWSGAGGIGIIDADPLFVDDDGADDVIGTPDDDLRLAAGSPAIDAGDAASLPADTADLDGDGDTAEPIPFDLDGNPRVFNVTVDMGAFEAEVVDSDFDGFFDDVEIAAGSDPQNPASTPEVCDGADNDLDGQVDEGFSNTDADADADCVDLDDDGDGIFDEVDLDPLNPSNEFSDDLFSTPTVVTSGMVVDVPAGVAIEITDAQAPSKGVRVTRTGPQSAGNVELFFPCAPLFTVLQKKGNATYTCGSLTIDVIDGTTSVEFVIDGQTHIVVIDVSLANGDPPAVVLLEETTAAGVLMAVTVDVAVGSGSTVTVDEDAVAPGTGVIVSAPPRVGEITGPPIDPIEVGAAIGVTADFTDQNVGDTHTAEWDWGDGSVSAGIVDEADGAGSVTGNHVYDVPGVYTVTLTVTDNNGDVGSSEFRFVVVYDPEGGFVTGGGWIDSPAGAYAADPTLTGKANFGFVSKYKKGANVPTGQTQFQFKVADLKFHSSVYQWLVVAGPHAKFKGSGTINGAGDYGFMLTATDGEVNGGGGVDGFRITIWDKLNGDAVVYDNQMGALDDSNETTAIGGGRIVVHDN